jgi:hypothetical protein
MKKMLVSASFVMLFTAAAMADGGGLPPVKPPKAQPPKAITAVPYLVADGGGLPPVKPPKALPSLQAVPVVVVADGGGLPPVKPPKAV